MTLATRRDTAPPWYLRPFYSRYRTYAYDGDEFYWERDLSGFFATIAVALIPITMILGVVFLVVHDNNVKRDYREQCAEAGGVLYNDNGDSACVNDTTGQRIWLDIERKN